MLNALCIYILVLFALPCSAINWVLSIYCLSDKSKIEMEWVFFQNSHLILIVVRNSRKSRWRNTFKVFSCFLGSRATSQLSPLLTHVCFYSGIELDGPISEQFLSLEPPPLEDEYLFSLGPDEGLRDLFDFPFDEDEDTLKTKDWWF